MHNELQSCVPVIVPCSRKSECYHCYYWYYYGNLILLANTSLFQNSKMDRCYFVFTILWLTELIKQLKNANATFWRLSLCTRCMLLINTFNTFAYFNCRWFTYFEHFRTHSVPLPIYCLFGSNLVTSDALIINKCMFLWKDDFSRSKWKPCRLQIHTIQLSDEPV